MKKFEYRNADPLTRTEARDTAFKKFSPLIALEHRIFELFHDNEVWEHDYGTLPALFAIFKKLREFAKNPDLLTGADEAHVKEEMLKLARYTWLVMRNGFEGHSTKNWFETWFTESTREDGESPYDLEHEVWRFENIDGEVLTYEDEIQFDSVDSIFN